MLLLLHVLTLFLNVHAGNNPDAIQACKDRSTNWCCINVIFFFLEEKIRARLKPELYHSTNVAVILSLNSLKFDCVYGYLSSNPSVSSPGGRSSLLETMAAHQDVQLGCSSHRGPVAFIKFKERVTVGGSTGHCALSIGKALKGITKGKSKKGTASSSNQEEFTDFYFEDEQDMLFDADDEGGNNGVVFAALTYTAPGNTPQSGSLG